MNKKTVEICFNQVDPEVMAILIGEDFPTTQHHGVTIHTTIKRTFWQWITRKPKQVKIIHMPLVSFDQKSGWVGNGR